MARQLRLEYDGALYHVTARGNGRQAIYLDDPDRRRFLALLGEEVRQQHWRCYAYCLMGNHYHLLVETPEGNLSQGMRRLNGRYTQAFNRRHHRVGHVLQGRYKSILVEKEAYLLELCRYIVLNPVRAQLVRQVKDWRWSSYRATVRGEGGLDWFDEGAVLGLFHRTKKEARPRYAQFVRAGVDGPSPWAAVRGQIFLGDEPFLKQMAKLIKKQSLTNVPRAQRQPTRLSGEEVLSRVGEVYALTPEKLCTRAHSEAYQCAAWLLRREANEPLGQVAARFGVSPSRISHIQRALETQALNRRQTQAKKQCEVKQ